MGERLPGAEREELRAPVDSKECFVRLQAVGEENREEKRSRAA